MRICTNCGAHLDPEERCDCRESLESALESAETREAAQILSKLPPSERRVAAALIKGYALAIESGLAG